MKKTIYTFVTIFLMVALPNRAFAGDGQAGVVHLDSVGVIPVALGQHHAGNIEVRVTGGFRLPDGVSCDGNILTTLKTSDPDKKLLAVLLLAKTLDRPIFLWITDGPLLNAFPGRCSIMSADLY